jgi:hypothetical protein
MKRAQMSEILRSNDLVLISAIEALLKSAGISVFVADYFASSMEGSIGAIPRRMLVPEEDSTRARRLLNEAGFGAELRPL